MVRFHDPVPLLNLNCNLCMKKPEGKYIRLKQRSNDINDIRCFGGGGRRAGLSEYKNTKTSGTINADGDEG